MFNSLKGVITAKLPQKVYLETNGIEWDITVPDSSVDALPLVGENARIFVYLQHTDVLMNLYGFATEQDRMLFLDLLKVDGIGPKGAVKIMSNISTSQLAAVLENGDVGALEKVPGVGKKTAGKMLLQLKGKLSLSENVPSSGGKSKSPYADVVSALVDMGYEKSNAQNAVDSVYNRVKDDEGFAKMTDSQKEDALFKYCIVELAR